ncbi:MAG: glutaminyl-peptide cyclotransferase [Flavobacteriaceae bacterium]|nr:glutaminyl-peptide cyclotransferase [Flavobacteriaceae bacterium]
MNHPKIFGLIFLVLFAISCGNDGKNSNELFAIQFEESKKSFKVEDELALSIQNKKNSEIQKIEYSIDGIALLTSQSGASNKIQLKDLKMGIRKLEAKILSDDDTYTIYKTFTITATETPKLYTYEIVESYPHDRNAYTQGLEFDGDTLYESTGQRKKSSLRKTNYKTGEVLKKVQLADQFFGEGLTILNDKIYQLTWQSKTGFIYDKATLEKKGTFVFNKSAEGWGLCNDGAVIYKSDGTEKIWTLDPNTLAEQGYIELYTHSSKIPRVNELEWVDGKIYANIYQKDAVAIVNPENGAVEGVIDFKGLKDQVTQHSELDVLNGVAYKGEPGILYITGKNWDKLFKVRVISK